MKQSTKAAVVIMILCAGAFLSDSRTAQAQTTRRAAAAQPFITGARVARSNDTYAGPVYVTIGGKERKIADEGIEVWVIEGGRRAVYSGRDGSGGFENEGQSLRIYDARTGRQRKILSEYVGVDKVMDVKTGTNRTALIVEMSDGGLGGSYLAVVDPERGEVFFRQWAKLLWRRGDIIAIGHYKEEDWGELEQNQTENAKVKPYKRERQNLNAILKGRVIVNKRDR
jgi:hypothetical protein